METSKTTRMLVAAALVSALAVLITSPAQAYVADTGGGSVPTAVVGNPGDSGWIAAEQATVTQTVGNPGDSADVSRSIGTVGATSSGSGGFDTGTFALIAGGALLALMLGGALLFTSRHRRVALP